MDEDTRNRFRAMLKELVETDNEYVAKLAALFDKYRDPLVLEPAGEIIVALESGAYDSHKLFVMKVNFMSDLLREVLAKKVQGG